jgi:hypothetical protein
MAQKPRKSNFLLVTFYFREAVLGIAVISVKGQTLCFTSLD